MVEMNSNIIITQARSGNQIIFYNRVSKVEGERSWKNLTQTCKITVPRYGKLISPNEPNYNIMPGDTVQVQLGYDGGLRTEFQGFVSAVKPNTPIEIMCEDAMWKLKQKTINKSWRKISMKDLILELVPGTDVTFVPDITLEPFRVQNVSVAKALEKLKDDYGLVIYFRKGQLFVGFAYYDTNVSAAVYDLKFEPLQNQMEFKNIDDVKLKVKAISILRDNTKIEVDVGDADGEQRTLHYYNIKTEAELKKIAAEEIKKMKFTGYTGSITTVGRVYSDHGWTADIKDDRYPERDTKVFIDGVKFNYDSNGYRREIMLGRKAGT